MFVTSSPRQNRRDSEVMAIRKKRSFRVSIYGLQISRHTLKHRAGFHSRLSRRSLRTRWRFRHTSDGNRRRTYWNRNIDWVNHNCRRSRNRNFKIRGITIMMIRTITIVSNRQFSRVKLTNRIGVYLTSRKLKNNRTNSTISLRSIRKNQTNDASQIPKCTRFYRTFDKDNVADLYTISPVTLVKVATKLA